MRRRLIALFVVELGVFSGGLAVTRSWVPIEEHPLAHILGLVLSGGLAVAVGLIVARRIGLM